MPHLQFSNPKIGSLRLSVKDVRLPDSIKEKLDEVEEVRFDSKGMELEEKSFSQSTHKHPFFYEWQQVEVFFDSDGNSPFQPPFTFRLNKQDTGLISQESNQIHKLYGQVYLTNSVGFTDFEIVDKSGKQVFLLKTEVFPQKLSYKEDFEDMIEEIAEMVYQLVYDYLQKTYALATPKHSSNQTMLEWVSILLVLFESLEKSIDLILRSPHFQMEVETVIKPAEKVRKTDKSLMKWALRNPRYLVRNAKKGIPLNENASITHLPELTKQLTHDRFENQFVVWAIRDIILTIDDLIKGLSRQYRKKEKIEANTAVLEKIQTRLRHRLNHPVLKSVTPWDQRMHYSSILTMAPGYRDFYHRFLLLRKGLSISQDDIFQLDYKQISTLYEYWCFLKMIKILKEDSRYELQTQDLIKVDRNRLTVNLKKGQESKIRMVNKATGEGINLWFNRSFGVEETHTFRQVPDHVIEFEKEGYDRPFRFILDAKYRFDRGSKSYPESKVKHGPPLDAIAQLHRYRDAILSQKQSYKTYTSAFKSLGGLILFPYPDQESTFRKHTFFNSRFEVNIGAVPLQPGKNKENILFKEFLYELFTNSPEALYEQAIEYEKSDHQKVIEASGMKVLIGLVPNDKYRKLRLDFHLGNKIYHTLAQGKLDEVDYVALYDQRERAIICYGKVIGREKRMGNELVDKGINWPAKNSAKQYQLFNLTQLRKCYLPFRGMKPFGRRYTSLHGLNQALKYQDDQYLWLDSYEWLRTWQEIQKMDKNATFSLSKNRKGKRRVVISFVKNNQPIQCLLENDQLVFEDEKGNVIEDF